MAALFIILYIHDINRKLSVDMAAPPQHALSSGHMIFTKSRHQRMEYMHTYISPSSPSTHSEFRNQKAARARCCWAQTMTGSSSSSASRRLWTRAPETGTRSAWGRSGCGSGRSGHRRSRCVTRQCIQLRFAQSSQGGHLQGGFPLARAHQRRPVPQPVTDEKVHG